ncbi:YtxH domain-containing protein [Salipaludibacillus sp. CF4.18]|uniref:YtxH domain-containing protein n=1 Tax=Salipaludibacillus sp. CF4.18 TaxID=3373081 RepID=UPI003EE4AC54
MTSEKYTEHNEQGNGVGSKIMTGMAVGALAGAAVVMFDSNSRSKVMRSAGQAKDSVVKMSSDVKADPTAAKDQMMERIQNATVVLKEAVGDLQKINNKANEEVVEQVNDVKKDAQDIISSAKETGEDLKDVGSKAVEAKDELVNNSGTEEASEENTKEGNTITNRPV